MLTQRDILPPSISPTNAQGKKLGEINEKWKTLIEGLPTRGEAEKIELALEIEKDSIEIRAVLEYLLAIDNEGQSYYCIADLKVWYGYGIGILQSIKTFEVDSIISKKIKSSDSLSSFIKEKIPYFLHIIKQLTEFQNFLSEV